MAKIFYVNGKMCCVTLTKNIYNYVVAVDGVTYKETPNLTFATQAFNEI